MQHARYILWSTAAVLGAMIAARWVLGPYTLLGIPVNVPLNPEGVFGFVATALLFMAKAARQGEREEKRAVAVWPACTVCALAIAALWPALDVRFLSDDFILVAQARSFTVSTLWPLFTSAGGDGFFRPLGYAAFDLNAAIAGADPRGWHLFSLTLHAANAALVALLAGRLGAGPWIALLAGGLFGLHGTHLEAAVWIAGRFDLLACLFTLAALLLFGRNTGVALACAWAALWSKEAAFVLPGLVTLLAWHERKPLRGTLPFWALGAAAFVYRWTLLGGIGGYEGGAAFYSLKFASTAKVVFARLWTSLYFPLNWSREPSLAVAVLACAYVATLLWLAWRGKRVAALGVCLAGLGLSILPPLHLLGGAADLSGGRLLYLPSVWFCLLLAFAVAGLERRQAIAVGAVFLGFHFAALRHDLPFWQRASDQVQAACVQDGPAPGAIEGVPALANGLAECRSVGTK